jgi:hypothetical protein
MGWEVVPAVADAVVLDAVEDALAGRRPKW